MKRLGLSILIGTFIWLSLGSSETLYAEPPIWAPEAVAQLIDEALTNNKGIQSLAAQVESLQEEVSFAGALDDPRLGLAVLNLPADSWEFDREPMTQKQISIAQKVPWFGKLSLKSQGQALKAVRQQALLNAKRLELSRQIANAAYDLAFVEKSLEINDRLTRMVSQVLRVAETKYASGLGLQQDVLQAQVELSKLLDEKIVLQRKHRTLKDRINELLNRESFAEVHPPQHLAFPDLTLKLETLRQQSLQGNPWLWVRQAEVDKALVEIELAKKDYWPDMDFKVAYGQRDEDRAGSDRPDFVSASVTLKIPLWQKSRQDKKLAATQKSHEAAMKSHGNLVDSLPHRIDALVTEIRDTQENYRLFADALVFQAAQWASSSLSAYEVGKVEFNTMINAQIRLLRFELQAERYLYTIYQKRAELEEVLGGPIASPETPSPDVS